jgi:hypothetical protein
MRRAALLAVAIALSCRSVPLPRSKPAPPAEDPSRGQVSVNLVADPNAPAVHLGPNEQFMQAQAMTTKPLPEYPPDLIPLHLPKQIVVIRVLIDERGRILDIKQSPLVASTPGPHLEEFEASVRTAVQQWRFYSASIRKFKLGPDLDGNGKPDYTIVTAQQPLKAFFDISFVFEVVNGKATVRTG